jgi:hypothetical protein
VIIKSRRKQVADCVKLRIRKVLSNTTMANSTGKLASAAAAKAATAPPPKGRSAPRPPSSGKGKAKGKGKASRPDEASDDSPSIVSPSNDSSFDDSNSSNRNDSFSYSKEGYDSRNVTTEGTTSLVDNLVETYTGDYSGIESHDHESFDRQSSGSTSHDSEYGHDCPHSPGTAHERFEKLDEAGEQLSVAQKKVDRILDKAVEARISDSKPVPEADEKRAEKEQERLTRAEGKLHRTRERLAEKQEFRRQRKLDYTAKRESAEKALLNKFGSSSAELRDHIMETFRPVIAQDSSARNDINQLEEAADWHLKTDSEAARLAEEGSAAQDESQEVAEQKEKFEGEVQEKKETELSTSANEKVKLKEERRKFRVLEREEKKRRELECRLDSQAFRDTVRNTSSSDRTTLVNRELEKLDKKTPTEVRKGLESRLNEQLSEVEVQQTRRSSDKEHDSRRKAVDTLLETKAQRAGKSGQELNSISDAVDDLDTESIRKTHQKLEDLDLGSVTSVLDLERKFGRDITDVRTDLEHQIARGGKSVTKARKNLSRLDRLVRRSQLMSEGDGWDALMSCITPSGPNLGRFLGLPDGFSGGHSLNRGGPILKDNPKVDMMAARRISQRMAQSGSRVDDKRKAKIAAQLGNAV